MLIQPQIERLAAMANALRPDWPLRSIQTHIENNHTHRAYRDLAIALAYVATDSESSTPARLKQPGPWWRASLVGDETPTPPGRCGDCHEFHGTDAPCPGRRDTDHATVAATGLAEVRAAYTQATAGLCPHGVGWTNCHQHKDTA
jgi:hypothetical protein